jgi:hypothetical protein
MASDWANIHQCPTLLRGQAEQGAMSYVVATSIEHREVSMPHRSNHNSPGQPDDDDDDDQPADFPDDDDDDDDEDDDEDDGDEEEE